MAEADIRGAFMPLEQMFQTEGWKLLCEELDSNIEGQAEAGFWDAKDWNDLIERRENLRALMLLRHYDEQIAKRKADAEMAHLLALEALGNQEEGENDER